MALLEVEHLSKTYGSGDKAVQAIGGLDFHVDEGEFVCIVGPSGCGKTTLLKCMSGLLPPTSGQARIHGERITAPPEQMALVLQEYSRSLFPWMSVKANIEFPLKRRKLAKSQLRARCDEAIEAVGLTRAADRYPWQLSGGMQQRVAIARALAYRPEILLMDEPFASVDAQTRSDLEDLVLRIRHEFNVTVLFVTHDIDESVYLSDRIIVLTNAPTSVQEVLPVELPRPRHQITTKEQPEFARLRAHVYQAIKGLQNDNQATALRS